MIGTCTWEVVRDITERQKSEPTEASFPRSHVRRVKNTKHNHWLREYYSNRKKEKKKGMFIFLNHDFF